MSSIPLIYNDIKNFFSNNPAVKETLENLSKLVICKIGSTLGFVPSKVEKSLIEVAKYFGSSPK